MAYIFKNDLGGTHDLLKKKTFLLKKALDSE